MKANPGKGDQVAVKSNYRSSWKFSAAMGQFTRMPALFIGHGSPMNAIEDTQWSRAWRDLGASLPRPKAILVVSAHWMTPGVGITAMEQPETIHDFGGFPDALFAMQYPAPGSPELARRVQALLGMQTVSLDQSWGLDHGAWSVLVHLFPDADIPVVQLSLDLSQPTRFHYELGQRLRPLRDEGVLVIASGNVVHNLRLIQWQQGRAAPEWSARVEQRVMECLKTRDHAALIDYPNLDAEALLAIPTSEHYLPLLYIAGIQGDDETASLPIQGIELGTISMLSVRVG